MNITAQSTRISALIAFALMSSGLTGCAALMSTTNTAAKAVGTVSNGLEATTNASVTKPDNGARYAQARVYVASQMPMIRSEAARGGGDNIRALAALMNEPDPQAFGQWMQDNYAVLFTNLEKPEMLVARIRHYQEEAARG